MLLAAAPAAGTKGTTPATVQEMHAEVLGLFKGLEAKIVEQCAEIDEKNKPNLKLGEEIAEQKDALQALRTQLTEMRAESLRNAEGFGGTKSVGELFTENTDVQTFLKSGWHQGHIRMSLAGELKLAERKTTIDTTAVGNATSGVINPQRVGYVPAAERRLTIRDILPSSPTSSNTVDFVKENVFTNLAGPQTESSDKDESALTFTTDTATVRTIAHWIPASSQVLADWPALQRIVNSKLLFGLKLKEEDEILTGSGAGVHLNGIQTQATAFETGRTITNDSVLDYLRHGISQVEEASEMADFIVLHPADFWEAMGLKDQASNQGNYVVGDPAAQVQLASFWGRRVISTLAQTEDTFLVGDSRQAEVFDREEAAIVVSTEHSDYFIKNLVAIRIEERLALAVFRAGAFISGSIASASPL